MPDIANTIEHEEKANRRYHAREPTVKKLHKESGFRRVGQELQTI